MIYQQSGMIIFIPYLVIRKAMAPLIDDPIMSERSMQLLRQPKHQNLSFISDSIGIHRLLQENRGKK